MKKIKKNYTNFILTVVVVLLFANLFKGEIIKPAHANMPLSTCVDGYKFAVIYSAQGVSMVQFYEASVGAKYPPIPAKC